jgi:hypothetical protein
VWHRGQWKRSIDNHVKEKIKEAAVWECQEAKVKYTQWQQFR